MLALIAGGAALADDVPDDAGAAVIVPPAQVTAAGPAAPSPESGVQPGDEPPEFAGMLEAHNFWRHEVGAPPLRWSPQAAAMAQRWADQLRTDNCPMRHNLAPERKKVFGENVYRYWRSAPYEPYHRNSQEVANAWGAESLWYEPSTNTCHAPETGVCGHYTQVVWWFSKLVGCGRAACGDSEVWVCEYFPRGNFVGRRPFPHFSSIANLEDPIATEEEMTDAVPVQEDVAPATPAESPATSVDPRAAALSAPAPAAPVVAEPDVEIPGPVPPSEAPGTH